MKAIEFNTKEDALEFSRAEALAHGQTGKTKYQYGYVEVDGKHYLNITGSILSTEDYELVDIEIPETEEEEI